MSYNDFEISTQDGRPVALYLIEWGKTRWRYTSADRPITIDEMVDGALVEVTYEPRAIKDSGMTQGQSSQNDLQIEGPGDLPIVRLYRGSAPTESIWLTVRRRHYDDVERAAPIYWKGTVWNVRRPTPGRCSIVGKPLLASLKRTGLRLCWTRECPHFLYDNQCRVDPEAWTVEGGVVGISGDSIRVTPATVKDAGWYRGGFASWTASDDGTLERRMIEIDTLDEETGEVTLKLFGLVDFIAIGDAVKMYPGCDRTPGMCQAKFNNLDNYGGFKDMPTESPFVGAIW